MTDRELMILAEEARASSYSPYSGYRVGAALLAASGKVYLGCNIENAAFTPTVCAERVALFKAVSEGERKFDAIAVSGAPDGEKPVFCAPCGVCRQALSEFCGAEMKVLLGNRDAFDSHTLGELLPFSFGAGDLG